MLKELRQDNVQLAHMPMFAQKNVLFVLLVSNAVVQDLTPLKNARKGITTVFLVKIVAWYVNLAENV